MSTGQSRWLHQLHGHPTLTLYHPTATLHLSGLKCQYTYWTPLNIIWTVICTTHIGTGNNIISTAWSSELNLFSSPMHLNLCTRLHQTLTAYCAQCTVCRVISSSTTLDWTVLSLWCGTTLYSSLNEQTQCSGHSG